MFENNTQKFELDLHSQLQNAIIFLFLPLNHKQEAQKLDIIYCISYLRLEVSSKSS